MKKVFFSALFALLVLTGCGSKSESVKCTMSQEQSGIKMDQEINIKIADSKFDSMEMTANVVIDDAYLSYKDMFISEIEKNLEKSFKSDSSVKPKVEATSNGAKITLSMTSAQADEFYGKTADKKVTKKEAIEKFSAQGYTCE